jgi:Zn-dependent protease with chaperone function
MVRDRQKNETASDVRAVALCGDAEALVRALKRMAFAELAYALLFTLGILL